MSPSPLKLDPDCVMSAWEKIGGSAFSSDDAALDPDPTAFTLDLSSFEARLTPAAPAPAACAAATASASAAAAAAPSVAPHIDASIFASLFTPAEMGLSFLPGCCCPHPLFALPLACLPPMVDCYQVVPLTTHPCASAGGGFGDDPFPQHRDEDDRHEDHLGHRSSSAEGGADEAGCCGLGGEGEDQLGAGMLSTEERYSEQAHEQQQQQQQHLDLNLDLGLDSDVAAAMRGASSPSRTSSGGEHGVVPDLGSAFQQEQFQQFQQFQQQQQQQHFEQQQQQQQQRPSASGLSTAASGCASLSSQPSAAAPAAPASTPPSSFVPVEQRGSPAGGGPQQAVKQEYPEEADALPPGPAQHQPLASPNGRQPPAARGGGAAAKPTSPSQPAAASAPAQQQAQGAFLRTRAECLERYREKKARRHYAKKIRYQLRKINADRRPRIKGRFVKKEELADFLAARQGAEEGGEDGFGAAPMYCSDDE